MDFGDLLTRILPLYHCILIMEDFNVHVCCPKNLIDSFDLIQIVPGPTQKCRHTVDLVLTYGFNLEVGDAVFSNYMPICLDLPPPFSPKLHLACSVQPFGDLSIPNTCSPVFDQFDCYDEFCGGIY